MNSLISGRQLGEHLLREVGEQMPIRVIVLQSACRERGVVMALARLQHHRDADGPAVRTAHDFTNRVRVERIAEASRGKGSGIGFGEMQIPGYEFGQLAMRAPTSQGQRRFDA